MPKKEIDEDRARRKELLEQKKAARKAEREKAEALAAEATALQPQQSAKHTVSSSSQNHTAVASDGGGDDATHIVLTQLPVDALHVVCSMLSAADLGRVTATCPQLLRLLTSARTLYLQSRLGGCPCAIISQQYHLHLCTSEEDARNVWTDALSAGGDTGRLVSASSTPKSSVLTNETVRNALPFCGYARFLEEVVSGYALLKSNNNDDEDRVRLPNFVQGRMASASPEHSLVRVGGDGTHCGPGGSGVAAQGVGKRGQLGLGQRRDSATFSRLRYGIGYNPSLRIVQVAAGGGLVRVAHSLLLTDTGRVLSFGTGQYGALGHGFSAAKQLPDVLQPTFIQALAHVRCVCIAAGELHSAAVTADADLYTWGDGFCGQLGHGDKRPCVLPKQVVMGGLDEECISNVTCGSRHTIAVTETNQCYSWGLGHFGVLGRSYTPFEYDADAAVVALGGMPGADNENGADHAANVDVERDAAAELAAHLDLIANLTLDDSSDQCIPMIIEPLQTVKIIGASAGHRHSLLLDDQGYLYSCGAGGSGCLGHGDTESHMFPCRIQAFDDESNTGGSSSHADNGNVRVCIRQMSAGVDMSMAVCTAGRVYAWGKTDRGRIGLGLAKSFVTLPRRVYWSDSDNNADSDSPKAVDVECGYVHSLIVGLNGTLHVCGAVGVDGQDDGQFFRTGGDEPDVLKGGRPIPVPGLNIWHRTAEPKEEQKKKERWQKLGKYEVKGRSKMLSDE
jgi:alpha-tubulin suppressor-like RCC1 family protein